MISATLSLLNIYAYIVYVESMWRERERERAVKEI